MKVFMLGWEFPPIVSGGLGVACYGLAKALNSSGVDVLFVLPKPLANNGRNRIPGGGISQEFKEVSTPTLAEVHDVVEQVGLPPAPSQSQENAPAVEEPREIDTPFQTPEQTRLQCITFAPVDVWLEPYMTPGQYQRMIVEDIIPNSPEDQWIIRYEHESKQKSHQAAPTSADPPALHHWHIPDHSAHAPIFGQPNSNYAGDLFAETERYARLAMGIAKTESFDLVHAHDWMTFEAAMAVAADSGKPLILQIHSTEIDRARRQANEDILELEREGLAAATKVIAVSYKTKTQLVEKYGVDPKKIEVVYNAVEHNFNTPATATQKKRHKTVLFLGRMTRQKGPDYFLQAAKKILAVESDVKFIMAGKGDMVDELKELAEDLEIHRRVIFTGFLKKSETEKVFRAADVYVMPSVSEPFGIAPLEALSHDVPVIISKQSGVAEVLKHVLKVDFWDTDDLANKILAVLRHPPLAQTLKEYGHEEVRQLSWDDSATKILDVYKQLLTPTADLQPIA